MPEVPHDSVSDPLDPMPDPFVARLTALAPAVDFDASRTLFERHRARPVASRRWLLPAAAVTLLVAGVVGIWAIARTGDSPTVPVAPIDTSTPTGTSIPADPAPGDFEILLVEETSARAGTIATAVDGAELDDALRPLAGTHDDLDVDFDSSIVAVFNVFGNACPLDLVGFDVTEAVWTPQLQGSEEPCEDIGITWAYVVTFDRSLFGSAVTFALPREDAPVGAPGRDGFEVIAVEQSQLPFGTIRAAIDASEYAAMFSGDLPGVETPSVDFGRRYVVSFTVPGNACPDTLTEITDEIEDPLLWVPRFEPTGEECEDPLITWTYVVAIDRPPVDADVTFRLPGDDRYEYDESRRTVRVAAATVTVQLREPGSAPSTPAPSTSPATGDEFVMLAVEETQLEFGSILVADGAEEFDEMWAQSFDEAEQPTVDFDHLVAVAFTLPDDACPDILTHFDIEPPADEGPTVWEPQFEPPPGGCRLPLITRTYVVGIDRQALGFLVTFRLPGDDVYDFETNTVTVKLGRTESAGSPTASPTLTPTGVRIAMPPVGEPRIAVGTFGIVWVVQHADGTASVLDAVVERRPDEDDGGATGLGDLVVPTTTGDGFGNGSFVWDSHGRAVNGPRTSDLTGFTGKVVDGEVELFLSDAITVPGSSEPFTGEFGPPQLENLPLLDLGTLPTLSFSGPIWRYLDATLVVENGVGTLCSVDPTASVDALATCDDGYPTAVRSTQPGITSWHFGPLLSEFDDFGRIVRIAPLGGRASRNDGPSAADPTVGPVTIVGVTPGCDPLDDPAIVEVRLLPAVPGDEANVTVQIVDDTGVRGETVAFIVSADPVTIEVPIDSLGPPAVGRAVVLSLGDPPVVLDEAPMTGCT